MDAAKRNLKIKAGVVKRLAKELEMYQQEEQTVQQKMEQMRAAGEDIYVLKKQEEVLAETQMMIPDTRRRLQAAYMELVELVESSSECAGVEEFSVASDLVKQYATLSH